MSEGKVNLSKLVKQDQRPINEAVDTVVMRNTARKITFKIAVNYKSDNEAR